MLDTMAVDIPNVSDVHAHTVAEHKGAMAVVVKEPVAWWASLRRFRNRRRRQQGRRPIREHDPDHVRQMVEMWAAKNRRWLELCQDGGGVYIPFRDIVIGPRDDLSLSIAKRLNAPVWEEKGWWPSNRVSYRRGGTVTEEEWDGRGYLDGTAAKQIPSDELRAIASALDSLPFEPEALGVMPPECVLP